VYRRSIARPEIVVKLCVRSGAFFSAGWRVSRSQRCLSVSATVFMSLNYSCERLERLAKSRTFHHEQRRHRRHEEDTEDLFARLIRATSRPPSPPCQCFVVRDDHPRRKDIVGRVEDIHFRDTDLTCPRSAS